MRVVADRTVTVVQAEHDKARAESIRWQDLAQHKRLAPTEQAAYEAATADAIRLAVELGRMRAANAPTTTVISADDDSVTVRMPRSVARTLVAAFQGAMSEDDYDILAGANPEQAAAVNAARTLRNV